MTPATGSAFLSKLTGDPLVRSSETAYVLCTNCRREFARREELSASDLASEKSRFEENQDGCDGSGSGAKLLDDSPVHEGTGCDSGADPEGLWLSGRRRVRGGSLERSGLLEARLATDSQKLSPDRQSRLRPKRVAGGFPQGEPSPTPLEAETIPGSRGGGAGEGRWCRGRRGQETDPPASVRSVGRSHRG